MSKNYCVHKFHWYYSYVSMRMIKHCTHVYLNYDNFIMYVARIKRMYEDSFDSRVIQSCDIDGQSLRFDTYYCFTYKDSVVNLNQYMPAIDKALKELKEYDAWRAAKYDYFTKQCESYTFRYDPVPNISINNSADYYRHVKYKRSLVQNSITDDDYPHLNSRKSKRTKHDWYHPVRNSTSSWKDNTKYNKQYMKHKKKHKYTVKPVYTEPFDQDPFTYYCNEEFA